MVNKQSQYTYLVIEYNITKEAFFQKSRGSLAGRLVPDLFLFF